MGVLSWPKYAIHIIKIRYRVIHNIIHNIHNNKYYLFAVLLAGDKDAEMDTWSHEARQDTE